MMRHIILACCVFWMSLSAGLAVERRTPLHPPVPLLDAAGNKVVASGQPVSTVVTCAACHDTQYIKNHSYHAWVGRNEQFKIGTHQQQRPWDYSPGLFGRWDPIFYRYLTPPGDPKLDLSTAEWIQSMGWRHSGGGPAEIGHGDIPLDQQTPGAGGTAVDPDAQILNPATGQPEAWDWKASGTVEMNCFLCHLATPDNNARVKALAQGHFKWASTATLAATGLVTPAKDGWKYNSSSFSVAGEAPAKTLGLGPPAARHCGQCHGQVHSSDAPLALDLTLHSWSTATKGEVFSPQQISMSAANIEGKQELTRPWDVHAASMLECRNCHFSLNNPAAFQPPSDQQPRHLRFEPRRLDTAAFATQPSHDFAKGHACQGLVAQNMDGTMRTCGDCHDADAVHDWLPYRDYHFARLSCEACHIPKAYAPALQQVDWTLVAPNGEPRRIWRGIQGDHSDPKAFVTGYQPVLLARKTWDRQTRLVPFNLITSWFWVAGDASPRPVRLADLKKALLDGDGYQKSIVEVLDTNQDGQVDVTERVLDSSQKVDAVRARLIAVGVNQPHIEGELEPHCLHHDVGPASWAIKDCSTCHTKQSRVGQPFEVAKYVPGGVMPIVSAGRDFELNGSLHVDDAGRLLLKPHTQRAGVYILGYDRWGWIDDLGFLVFILTLLGVAGHAALRILAARRHEATTS